MAANPISLTVSSSSISSPYNLDWMAAKYTAFGVNLAAPGTATYTVEGTFQDITQTASASVLWFALRSAMTATSSAMLFTGPLGAIRLNVSAASSAVLSLKGMQGVGW